MARVLLAWELGGDYGHLMRFLTIAQELAKRGHEPILALRELTHVDAVLRDAPFTVFQAPIFAGRVDGLPAAAGFAETLMRLGFLYPSVLTGLCRGWRSLVDFVQPALLVFDYAPTGLLATRNLAIPRVLFGNSFSIPPSTAPMPTYRWWEPADRNRVVNAERIVLGNANAALARRGEPPMARLADLLAADEVIIATSQDFDQYPSRTGAHYWGMVANVETGVPPPWPTVGRRRIFAYVKPHFRDFARLLEALRLVDAAVVVHAPGVSTNDMHRFTAANIAFSREPVRMADVRRDCNMGICHAGGTASTLVTAGRPVLLLPQHLEQMMMAKRVQQTGACLVVDFEKPAPDYRRLVERLLAEPSFTTAAGALAQRYADDSIASRIERIVDRMEALMTQGARGRREAAGEAAAAS